MKYLSGLKYLVSITAINNQDAADSVNQPLETFQSLGGNLFEGTPEVLLLEGYGTQFKKIPVVLTNVTFNYTSEVDYIKSSEGAWVPILQEVSISLKEAREVTSGLASISKFDLAKYKAGTLEFW